MVGSLDELVEGLESMVVPGQAEAKWESQPVARVRLLCPLRLQQPW